MRKLIAIPAASLFALAITACSTSPNPYLEQVRSRYAALQMQPDASRLAPLETKDAGEWVTKAEKAYQDNENEKKVTQIAYLANRRVDYAEQTIALRSAEIELKSMSEKKTEAKLDILKAQQTDRGMMYTIGDVLFGFDRADLRPGAMEDVRRLGAHLRNNQRHILVEGYTDSVGSAAYNQRLSEQRAESVRRVLINEGVEPSRIATRGYGKSYPVASNSSDHGRAQNRRVEVTLSNDNRPVRLRSTMDY